MKQKIELKHGLTRFILSRKAGPKSVFGFIPFIILIMVVIGGVFAFWYYRGTIFSKESLAVEVFSQDNVSLGQEIEYTVHYKNNGSFILQDPKLTFELPKNSLTEDSKIRFTKALKNMNPGDEGLVSFKARLLGKEGDKKSARAVITYTPHNLSARYESEASFTALIDSVPILLEFDLPLRFEKGEETAYALDYSSYVDYPLENVSIKIDKQEGFETKSSEPLSLDNSEWKLKTLNKSDWGEIIVTGTVLTEPGTDLNFVARLGIWVDGSFIVLKEVTRSVTVTPFSELPDIDPSAG